MDINEIRDKIHIIRGRGVMLDFDLAAIYCVETKYLKRSVRQNMVRFPEDFMFELSNEEYNDLKMRLRCKISTLEADRMRGKYPKYPPFAFTQLGVAMLTGVLNSEEAIYANINIMRAFVDMREYILTHASASIEMAQLRERVFLLEQSVKNLSEEVKTGFINVYTAIDELTNKPPQLDPNRRMIGYK